MPRTVNFEPKISKVRDKNYKTELIYEVQVSEFILRSECGSIQTKVGHNWESNFW